ncbi:MAG: histidine kinase dimerization/phospho-acceptor domain-containing protein, partial [Pseudomonadota bacterium]
NAELEQHRHHQEKRVAQLNAILGLSQILSRTPLTAEQQDCVDKILISGRSLLDLLNDILDYSE